MSKQIEKPSHTLALSLSEAQSDLRKSQANLKSVDSQIEMQKLVLQANMSEKSNPTIIKLEIDRLEKLLADTQRKLAIQREKLASVDKQSFISGAKSKLKALHAKRIKAQRDIQIARCKVQLAEVQREVSRTLRTESERQAFIELMQSVDEV